MNAIVLSIPVFFILIGIEIIYDHYQNRKLYRMNDAISNINCGIFEQITGVFAKVFTVIMYAYVYEQFRFFSIPDTWYWLVILFFGVDFFYYWAHRKSHEINLMWLGHVVHHQSEEYNLSVALRQGALQKVFTSFFYLPLALMGFSPEYFLYLAAFNTLYQFWIHTEVITRLGPLEQVFNTPSHHRVHHGRNPKYIDRNHAGVFIIWDMMFGTFQPEEERPVYGITTPVNSWNPLAGHAKPFINLWSDLKMVKEWKYKIQLFLMPPGWLPEKYGGYREPNEVTPDTYLKFDTVLNREMNWYLFMHFIFLLVGVSSFLFGLAALVRSDQFVFTLLITFSIVSMGLLFEGRKYAGWFEIARLFAVGFMLIAFFRNASFKIPFAAAITIVTIVSIIFIVRFYLPKEKS